MVRPSEVLVLLLWWWWWWWWSMACVVMVMVMVMVKWLWLVLCVVTFTCECAGGLRITHINVPSPVVVGEAAWLECEFLEENENVYALKWYLGLDEFYRWTPAETPSVKTFEVKGSPLVVDTESSSRGRVRITDVRLGATGVFRCEVSAEAPSFHTESDVSTMTVLDLPDEKPRITGVEPNYQVHQDVRLNCSSPRSQPPATLSFYVNNVLAEASWLRPYTPLEDQETGLETAVMGLRFPLRPRLLQGGAAVVKCTAAIEDKYWDSTVAFLHSDLPHQASVMEGRASHASGCVTSPVWLFTCWMALWRLIH